MSKWIIFTTGAIVVGVAIAVFLGQVREASKTRQLQSRLSESATRPANRTVDFASFSDLPPPVANYFRHVLTDGQHLIQQATLQQVGVLRTGTATEKWSVFTARQLIVPPATGFLWNARVEMPAGTHVRVLDSYITGSGAGRVSLLSAFAVAAEAGTPELNAGALHRYLAEAVWFPTALLPQAGVEWRPIDAAAALATLSHRGTTVALEFRFNPAGEVTGIYSAGRYGRFEGEYRQVPWEGHFRDYQVLAGMRVPLYGEVGWYVDGTLHLVWQGHILDAQYELVP